MCHHVYIVIKFLLQINAVLFCCPFIKVFNIAYISNLKWFLKDNLTLGTDIVAAINSALHSEEWILS